ncbi:bifunctional methylenetetrahydrofolate dehydrogenase/methenyltetrahydrofolate cyclohydrolase FolD [Helicobacter saguini]|uniref:Bifunctional protein FolD n=1 Tax=Helicobacter saguini TaxID=1548018 RepID=A0A347VT43_9HELI|nr:bifunctional methylenetetrahydrofolate dehydrogenase/methenyltetrahydrofolate cyclohydrolase FolD [Helicobacter saguini]MWV62245.1 bifunctional methylenetetrahydrofolate dehydrogenase/methenyltetrahydrofolate cyclohydrolase FolD [Helicobacter saguini]MWV67082.1 bifunctional methylenetetrahydrofolate dehydrogenase/methenyltetrahydrofolate cyclohydrolase FolD [Helicobacter saguini]MWV69432.1 bifunctional methylenetetrahydrofolate dehydrogenase/methenyltetrahydrofolate cyclohydrolase FolD [Helic
MILLDGKSLAKDLQEKIKKDVATLAAKGVIPSLAVILVGSDPASQTYVNMKAKACKNVGITSILHEMPQNISQADLLNMINNLNANANLDGILVQLPLPSHINTYAVLESVAPQKDVDGFHTQNSGKLFSGISGFVPATPLGVMSLLSHYNIALQGKDVCIIGASNIVGKPLAALMLNAGATISVCHIHTRDLGFYTRNADIICVAVGKPNLITRDMVKQGAIVVDIGITRLESGKIVGDVDFDSVAPLCSYITPVPGGVGPMTIASLLQNTLKSAEARADRM